MLATYQGKLITSDVPGLKLCYWKMQDEVDELIASGSTWPLQNVTNYPVSNFKHEDGTEITDADTIPVENVPAGADYLINVELAYVYVGQ